MQAFPQFLAAGMTYEEYWHGEPELTQAYILADKIRREQRNYEFWLQGLYIYHALCVALSNTLGGSKEQYMDKPLDIFPPTEEEIERRQEEEAKELERRLNQFAAMFARRQDGKQNRN